MKFSLLLISLLVVPLTITAQKQLTEVDLRVNGIGSGSTYNAVVRNIGKPESKTTEFTKQELACSNKPERYTSLKYSGLIMDFLKVASGTPTLVRFEVSSSKWDLSGIRIGAERDKVISKFGKPVSVDNRENESTLYYVTPENLGGVNFYFRSHLLYKVVMSETLC